MGSTWASSHPPREAGLPREPNDLEESQKRVARSLLSHTTRVLSAGPAFIAVVFLAFLDSATLNIRIKAGSGSPLHRVMAVRLEH